MRIARVERDGQVFYAAVEGNLLRRLEGCIFDEVRATDETYRLDEARLLSPVQPSKVVAVGINYADHMEEMKHKKPEDPVIFIKPASCVIGPDEPIVRPPQSARVDYEAELGVVIGRRCQRIGADEAMDYVLGFTCVNDVTARDIQQKDGQWTRAKGFYTFAPIGPWIETEFDYTQADVESRLNGKVCQHSNTRLLMNPIPKLISFISQVMTLEAGDVIATGTPAGIGPMVAGDVVEIEVEGIGILRNPVIDQVGQA